MQCEGAQSPLEQDIRNKSHASAVSIIHFTQTFFFIVPTEKHDTNSIPNQQNQFLDPHLVMSELEDPTSAEWEYWEPLIRNRYKKEPLRIIRQEMEDNGLRVT
jgi:hypothetical protein